MLVAVGLDFSHHDDTTSRRSPVAEPPGATNPHTAEVSAFEYGATVSPRFVAPTTRACKLAKLSRPGPRELGLPAATIGMAPAFHASSTALRNDSSVNVPFAFGLSPTLRFTTWAPWRTTHRMPASTSAIVP